MNRPIVFDMTHLRHRLSDAAPTGIDRVDLMFGRHFAAPGKIAAAAQYGRTYPKVSCSSKLGEVVRQAEMLWKDQASADQDTKFLDVMKWITSGSADNRMARSGARQGQSTAWNEIKCFFHRMYPSDPKRRPVPEGAVYLNIAQHAAENAVFFEWLSARKDVRPIFFIHDLIPLDFPEYWPEWHKDTFSRRVNTIFRHASALITSTASVRARVLQEMDARAVARVPVYSAHLPSPTEIALSHSSEHDRLRRHPYFVVLGTIEPRKNHSLVLNVWRRLAMGGGPVPKLVVIGKRGWENENVVAMLDRCPSIADHVLEVAGLSNAGVSILLANACALLMPSFAEGYGLPLVEALNVGAPVIASNIPVFREVTQGRAIFLDPTDGIGWSDAITALADMESEQSRAAREQAKMFRPVMSKTYFDGLENFLATL